MIIVYGTHRFVRRRVAYRQDFCVSCESERVTEQIRSFVVGHLYWIPLLPLGFFKEWRCPHCGLDPTQRVRTSRKLVRTFAGLVGLVAAMVTWVAIADPKAPTALTLLIAAGIWALAAGIVYLHVRNLRPPANRKAALARIRPASITQCAYCQGPLRLRQVGQSQVRHCATCQVDRLAA